MEIEGAVQFEVVFRVSLIALVIAGGGDMIPAYTK